MLGQSLCKTLFIHAGLPLQLLLSVTQNLTRAEPNDILTRLNEIVAGTKATISFMSFFESRQHATLHGSMAVAQRWHGCTMIVVGSCCNLEDRSVIDMKLPTQQCKTKGTETNTANMTVWAPCITAYSTAATCGLNSIHCCCRCSAQLLRRSLWKGPAQPAVRLQQPCLVPGLCTALRG